MKNAAWLIVGIALGFVAAHQVSKTPQGKQFFDDVDSKAREFGSAVVDGYKQREAELRAAVAEAEDTIADLTNRLK
ncbi:hypothetical protein [Microcella sp.]|jgi:hypothetical protein|uniref:hypothetical protein n=1 Tax=Microcella sp. TaxID=1913979 RepID=UPI000AA5A21B|nr:hypothetical protein [Microbacteriaceae bacterium]OYX53611.1 MAG: hypothetical protein B7Y93_07540 [Micrococcales bacterium 32-70-13]